MGERPRWLAAVWLLLAGAAWAGACRKPEPIRLGFLGGLTGRVADLGVGGRNGAILAVEQRNAAGGVRGHPVELLVRDDEQDNEATRGAVTDLLRRGVEVIVGPMTSSVAMAAVPLVNGSGAILVSPTVTTTALDRLDDHFLRVISHTTDYASKSARYLFTKQGRRRVAAVCEQGNSAYTESWLRDFRQTFEALGGRLTRVDRYRSGPDVSLLEVARELLSGGPDAVLIITNAVDAALLCQQLRKLSPGVRIAMSEWASTERFAELAGAAADGVIVAQFIDRTDRTPRYQAFHRDYLERFGHEPGFAGLAGYDAATVVLDAFADRRRGETLKAAILRIGRFRCVQQEIAIDRFGDANRRTFVTAVRSGRYETLE